MGASASKRSRLQNVGLAAAAAVGALAIASTRVQAEAHRTSSEAKLSDCVQEVSKVPASRSDGKRIAAFFDVDGTLWRAFKQALSALRQLWANQSMVTRTY